MARFAQVPINWHFSCINLSAKNQAGFMPAQDNHPVQPCCPFGIFACFLPVPYLPIIFCLL
jgi:hypothetical protein